MQPFEYLSVLLSIIVGLAMSHLLAAVARLIQLRREVRLHAPTLLWMGFLFLFQVQTWWSAFSANREVEWNFFDFLLFLLIPILVYLLTYVLLPDLENAAAVDLRASFQANRAWFFGMLILAVLLSFARDLTDSGRIVASPNTYFRVSFLPWLASGAIVRRESWQLALAALTLAGFCAYILVLFLTLPA